MTHPSTDPRIPPEMIEQFASQVKMLPETKQALVTGYLKSAFIWGLMHGYDRRDNSDTREQ